MPYMARSWPTKIIVDAEGIIRFYSQAIMAEENFGKVLDALIEKTANKTKAASQEYDKTKAASQEYDKAKATSVQELFPRIAASDGKVFVTYTSNHKGNNNVYFRRYDGEKWLPDQAVTEDSFDNYGSVLAVDGKGRVWVAWCSNKDGRYNIYCRSYTENNASEIVRVTDSADDAMNPNLCLDKDGTMWLAYYEWIRWKNGLSRDREVYVRSCKDGVWSKDIHVSPEDVPEYEDHTDPVLCPMSTGGVFVAWSWDYHPEKDSVYNASSPTIFGRHVTSEAKLGKIHLIGTESKDHFIDLSPSIAMDASETIWALWDSSSLKGQEKWPRYVVARCVEQSKPQIVLAGPYDQIGSLRLIKNAKGSLLALWAARKNREDWEIYRSQWNENKWSEPIRIEGFTGCHSPDATLDAKGNLWIVVVKASEMSQKIQILRQE